MFVGMGPVRGCSSTGKAHMVCTGLSGLGKYLFGNLKPGVALV